MSTWYAGQLRWQYVFLRRYRCYITQLWLATVDCGHRISDGISGQHRKQLAGIGERIRRKRPSSCVPPFSVHLYNQNHKRELINCFSLMHLYSSKHCHEMFPKLPNLVSLSFKWISLVKALKANKKKRKPIILINIDFVKIFVKCHYIFPFYGLIFPGFEEKSPRDVNTFFEYILFTSAMKFLFKKKEGEKLRKLMRCKNEKLCWSDAPCHLKYCTSFGIYLMSLFIPLIKYKMSAKRREKKDIQVLV